MTDATAPTRGVELEFAASLVGGLVLLFGFTWLAACVVALGTEGWRAAILQRFLWPALLARVVILAPLMATLLGVGFVGAATLTALRGWLRLSPGEPLPAWVSALAAAAAGAGLTTLTADVRVLVVAALLAIFAAGILAVHRRLPGLAAVPAPEEPARQQSLLGSWAVVGVAVVSMSWAVVLAVPAETGTIAELGRIGAVLAGASAAGLAGGKRWVRNGHEVQAIVLCLLLSAVAWVFAARWGASSTVVALSCVAVVAGCGSACMQSGLRWLAATYGSGQRAFAWQLGAVTGGMTLALLAATALRSALRPQPLRPAATVTGPAARAVYQMYQAAGRVAVCGAAREHPAGEPVSVRDIDLRGPRYALVVLARKTWPGGSSDFDRGAARRMIGRCVRSLVRGGRLAVDEPNVSVGSAALEALDRADRSPDWRAHLLRVSDTANTYVALLVGADVPAWVTRHAWPETFSVELEQIGDGPDGRARLVALVSQPDMR